MPGQDNLYHPKQMIILTSQLQSNQQMRSKHGTQLIQFFLRRSPRNRTKAMNQIFLHNQIPQAYFQSDETFVTRFLADIECDDLIPSPYPRYPLMRHPQPNKKSNKLQQTKHVQLIDYIKHFQKSSPECSKFSEADQFINLLSAGQAQDEKKYLVYLYKVMKKGEKRFPSLSQDLADTMTRSLISKIYEGNQELQRSRKKEAEAQVTHLLRDVRSMKEIGDVKGAREGYEKIYRNVNADNQVRMEALEFLCQKSSEKGDRRYLKQIMSEIKRKGDTDHEDFVKSFIEKYMNKREIL